MSETTCFTALNMSATLSPSHEQNSFILPHSHTKNCPISLRKIITRAMTATIATIIATTQPTDIPKALAIAVKALIMALPIEEKKAPIALPAESNQPPNLLKAGASLATQPNTFANPPPILVKKVASLGNQAPITSKKPKPSLIREIAAPISLKKAITTGATLIIGLNSHFSILHSPLAVLPTILNALPTPTTTL